MIYIFNICSQFPTSIPQPIYLCLSQDLAEYGYDPVFHFKALAKLTVGH